MLSFAKAKGRRERVVVAIACCRAVKMQDGRLVNNGAENNNCVH